MFFSAAAKAAAKEVVAFPFSYDPSKQAGGTNECQKTEEHLQYDKRLGPSVRIWVHKDKMSHNRLDKETSRADIVRHTATEYTNKPI